VREFIVALPIGAVLRATFSLTCPRCGKGKIFDGLLKLKPQCPVCAFDLATSDTGDGPAVFLIFAIGFLFLPLVIYVEVHADRPGWLSLLIWAPAIIALTLGLMRPVKALSVALSFHTGRRS
jgi:uncharacterized protein (DUF983 family)